ncbi:MAG: PAS domain S-box protein [Candidatus Omnitrophota bacterium]|jgi:PAS domain S-box-containing protein
MDKNAEMAKGLPNRPEYRWEAIFDAINQPIFIQDENFVIIRMNKAFAEAFKMAPSDIVGKKCYEVLHRRNSPWPTCPFEKTQCDQCLHVEEVDDPNIGVPLQVTTSPLFDRNKRLIGSVHIARDISDMRKKDEAVSRLAALVNSSAEGIIGVSLDGKITSWNLGAKEMYGYDEEEVIGVPVSRLVPQERAEETRGILETVLRGESVKSLETKRLRKDGQAIDAMLSVSPVKGADGGIVGIVSVSHDITSRKKAEEALAQKMASLERFQKVTVDREMRMKELKTKIADLEARLHQVGPQNPS